MKEDRVSSATRPDRNAALLAWGILAAVAGLVMVIRVRMFGIPFERDEGEFVVMGRMILDGVPPYAEAYNLKPPGIYLAYAAVMALFGQNPPGVHAGLLTVNLLCALFLFLIVRRLRGPLTAAVSTAAFLALSATPGVVGLAAHATHFVILPALAGMFLLLRRAGALTPGEEPGQAGRGAIPAGAGRARLYLIGAGVLMGVSFLMKQPGVFFILLGGVMVALAGRGGRSAGVSGGAWSGLFWYSLGAAIPIASTLAWLWTTGVFDRFWFWVVTYALRYGSQSGLGEGLDTAWGAGSRVIAPALLVWGIAAFAFYRLLRGSSPKGERALITAFVAASVLAVAMGFHFRGHYFVLLLPAVAVLFGLGLGNIRELLAGNARWTSLAVPAAAVAALLAIGQIFYAGAGVFFAATPDRASRLIYGTNPFVESPMIGEAIGRLTRDDERIAIVGSEPQIYFYADRRPATGYLYTYSLVEDQPFAGAMRDEMIAEIERARPRVLVYVNHPTSWLMVEKSDLSVFRWFAQYRTREGYTLAGIVEVVSPDETVSVWGEEARTYTPRTRNYTEVWRLPER